MTRLTTLILLSLACTLAAALEVAPDSPCGAKCIDDPRTGNTSTTADSSTQKEDIACLDDAYTGANSTQIGQKFADCNTCLRNSGYRDPLSNERDVQWFVKNNRAALDWCVFGRFDQEVDGALAESRVNQKCGGECGAIRKAADYMVTTNHDFYQFCDADGNFTADAESCRGCLYREEGMTILGNGRLFVEGLRVKSSC